MDYSVVKSELAPVCLSWKNLNVDVKSSSVKLLLECLDKQNSINLNEHVLLNDVSGSINGGFWAIMGPSGSGKTTLLSALALRLDTFRMNIKGDLRMNGHVYTKHQLKCISGYVMQDDLVNPNLTVAETLSYTAELRMARNLTKEERLKREVRVMKLMGIYHRKDVIVGDTRKKGISGGERKRLCIAMELLNKPSLLFLDEPTSGLDSETALSVTRSLHQLASKGRCTVICTIHQPQPQIFNLFNGLLLLRHGSIVYQGSPSAAISYFASTGLVPPEDQKPGMEQRADAEQLLAILSLGMNSKANEAMEISINGKKQPIAAVRSSDQLITFREKGDIEGDNGNNLGTSHEVNIDDDGYENSDDEGEDPADLWQPPAGAFCFDVEVDLQLGSDKLSPAQLASQASVTKGEGGVFQTAVSTGLEWTQQFIVLFRRCVHLHIRRWDILAMNVAVTILVAFFVCSSVWYHIGTGKASASRRQPCLFFCVIHQGIVAALQGTHSFPLERALMLRERAAGSYVISAYFLAKSAADFLFQIWAPVIFTCIVYPSVGFADTPGQFMVFMGFMILTSNATSSLMNMLSCLFVSIEMSTVVAACSWEILRLYGGFFIAPSQMSLYPNWRFMDDIDYIKYAYVGISLNEHENMLLTCTKKELSPNGACVIAPLNVPPYTGERLNAYYGFDQYTISECAGYLVLYIVLARLISYLALRFIKV